MTETLLSHRDPIALQLAHQIEQAAPHLDRVGAWAPDLRQRLAEFATRGKLVRGSLVAVGAQVFDLSPGTEVYRVAAAVELVQSFLLIHDDIMDEDPIRRGTPAIHEQYRRLGSASHYSRRERFGESMAICGGDVAMLLAFESIATGRLEPAKQIEIVRRIASEIADVGVAQMADVANGHRRDNPTEEEILDVYRYKTGRYTFSLPLSLGALLANAPPDQIEQLGRWGELQGIIFQIRDDQLGLMEDGADTGKPAGSDIGADKKTLHRQRLIAAAQGTKWKSVISYFGSQPSQDQLDEIREALVDLGVLVEMAELTNQLNLESISVLDQVTSLTDESRLVLLEIARFNRERRQ